MNVTVPRCLLHPGPCDHSCCCTFAFFPNLCSWGSRSRAMPAFQFDHRVLQPAGRRLLLSIGLLRLGEPGGCIGGRITHLRISFTDLFTLPLIHVAAYVVVTVQSAWFFCSVVNSEHSSMAREDHCSSMLSPVSCIRGAFSTTVQGYPDQSKCTEDIAMIVVQVWSQQVVR